MKPKGPETRFVRTGSCLLFVTLLSACIAFGTGCGSAQERSKRHFEQAEHLAAQGKTNEAIVEYRRAIQLNPANPKAHLALSKIFVERSEFLSAYQQLSFVGQNDPNNREAQEMMADLRLKAHDFAGARDLARTLVGKYPGDTQALMVLAESSLALKDPDLARSTIDHVLQIDPTNSQAWYLKAMVQLSDQKSSESEESLAKAIASKPDFLPPVTALAALMARRGDLTGAEKVIRQALERDPQSIQVRYLLATFLMAQKRGPEAEEVFRQIAKLGDSDPENRGALARYYVTSGNFQTAIKEYQNILKQHPDDIQNSLQLASVYIEQGNTSGAEELVNAVAKKKPNDLKTVLFRGRLRIQKGQIDEGIKDLQHAGQLDPQSALPLYFLGLAYLQEGKAELAEDALNKATQLGPNYLPAHLALANLLLQEGRPDKAIATIEKSVEQKPQVVGPYLVRTLALVEQGHFDEAEKETLPLVDEFPQGPARAMIYQALAKAKFAQKRFEEAHDFAKQSLGYEPVSKDSLYILGASKMAMKKPDEGLAEVESYVHASPKWAPGYEVLGQLQALAGRTSDAESSLKTAINIDPSLTGAQLLLSDLEKYQGNLDEAMSQLSNLARSQPQSVEAQVRMGQIAELKQDWNAAESYYSKALQLAPTNVIAKNNLAWVYAEHGGNLDMALKLAQEAKAADPNDPNISDTLAWILVKKQIYGTAIQLLRNSVQEDPKNASYSYHLGVAYYGAGQKAEAERSLQSALKLQPDFANAADARHLLEAIDK